MIDLDINLNESSRRFEIQLTTQGPAMPSSRLSKLKPKPINVDGSPKLKRGVTFDTPLVKNNDDDTLIMKKATIELESPKLSKPNDILGLKKGFTIEPNGMNELNNFDQSMEKSPLALNDPNRPIEMQLTQKKS